MEVLYLGIVFLGIIAVLALRHPLHHAILVGLVMIVVLYRIPLGDAAFCTSRVITVWSSFSVLVTFYLITFLQRILEARQQIRLAQQDLNGIFHNRRVNVAGLPLPPYLVFAALMFAATVISGSTGAIAMGTPLAFAAMPGGMPLMVYLMCITHAASQISPTHVCLVVASDYYHISLGELVRKTIPFSLAFCVLMTVYYQILLMIV